MGQDKEEKKGDDGKGQIPDSPQKEKAKTGVLETYEDAVAFMGKYPRPKRPLSEGRTYRDIRTLRRYGFRITDIAKRFNTDVTTIREIIVGE